MYDANFCGVQPGEDAVIALAQVVDVGHSGTRSTILHVNGCVVAQIDVVIATVRREKVDDHQDVRRLLADRDPLVLDFGRQPGMARATRFCTTTSAVFRSTPMSKVTVSE